MIPATSALIVRSNQFSLLIICTLPQSDIMKPPPSGKRIKCQNPPSYSGISFLASAYTCNSASMKSSPNRYGRKERLSEVFNVQGIPMGCILNRPGFPGECFICELRLPAHHFRWKHNTLFLLLPEGYGQAFPVIVYCYTSPPRLVWPVPLLHGFSSSYGVLPPLCKDH